METWDVVYRLEGGAYLTVTRKAHSLTQVHAEVWRPAKAKLVGVFLAGELDVRSPAGESLT
jgi:hypothetical protein